MEIIITQSKFFNLYFEEYKQNKENVSEFVAEGQTPFVLKKEYHSPFL